MSTEILHNAARCKKCGDVLESKHRYDFRVCTCWKNDEGGIAVDGGYDYIRRVGNLDLIEDLSEYEESE